MPGPKCIVQTCRDQYVHTHPIYDRLAYHRYPRQDDLRKIWFKKLALSEDTVSGFVCSRHFRKEDYIRDLQAELLGYVGRRKLKPNAIPSRNLPYEKNEIPEDVEEQIEKERHEKLIEDCLKESGQERSILSFDLFKKLKYSKCDFGGRGRKPFSRIPDEGKDMSLTVDVKADDPENRLLLVTLPSGEQHCLQMKRLEEERTEQSSVPQEILVQFRRRLRELKKKLSEDELCRQKRWLLRERRMMEKILLATYNRSVKMSGSKVHLPGPLAGSDAALLAGADSTNPLPAASLQDESASLEADS